MIAVKTCSAEVPALTVVGGGPAGLSAAYEAAKRGAAVTVLERLEVVGGLARTIEFAGGRYDVGPHRFFTTNPEVQSLFIEIAGEELIKVPRRTRVLHDDKFFNYPLTPLNALMGAGIFESLRILASYVRAKFRRLSGQPRLETFEDWVVDRFGRRLFERFFKTYTEKVWGIPCHLISADWASQRIKGLSLAAAIVRAVFKRKKIAKTLIDEFWYLRRGAGQLYHRLARTLEDMNVEVRLGCKAERIFHEGSRITAIEVRCSNGRAERQSVERLLCSVPLTELVEMFTPAPPTEVIHACQALRYRNHICVNLEVIGCPFLDNWIYVHSAGLRMARVTNYRNFSAEMASEPDTSPLTVEYFCFPEEELWRMPDEELICLAKRELAAAGIVPLGRTRLGFVLRSEKAYPVIEIGHRDHVERIRAWIARFENLWPIGRSGMFKYNNQDHAIATGLLAARKALGLNAHDPWLVNIDAEYQEPPR